MSSHHSSVPRTAPIPIAPKPARPIAIRRDSRHSADRIPPSMAGADSGSSESPTGGGAWGPCESCRRRHIRCIPSDDDESCIACQINGGECSLLYSPQHRKRKMNGDSTEDESSKRGSPGRSLDNGHRRRHHNASISSSAAASVSLVEEMAHINGPTLMRKTLGLQLDRYSQYIGPTTDFEPSLINLSAFDPHDESLLARGTLRKVSDNDVFLMLPDSITPGYDQVQANSEEIARIVAPHGRTLVDLYFTVVHPGFPIIQKGVFLEKYERDPLLVSPPLLAAMYILAINWWDQSEDLTKAQRPDVRQLERLVRITLADSMYRPKLSTVQAGLLLSQRPAGDQWAPTGQLVTIAQELGLHLDCTHWKIPPWEKGLRKRLAWAMYMQDKWGALVHGRPSHIFSSNWAVQPLGQHDFPDVEWDEGDAEERIEIERGRILFSQMVRLSQILAEILETFYTLQAQATVANAGPQGTHLVLSLAKPIQLKLKEWYSALPNAIKLESPASASSLANGAGGRLSPVGYLHLAYFAAEITLHRRIIRSFASSGDSSSSSSTTGGLATAHPSSASLHGSNAGGAGGPAGGIAASAPPAGNSHDQYIQHICRGAAKARLISAMDFVNRLTPAHLRAFWYFASKTNFALIGTFGSLLWATSPGREEADWYRRRLGEYRWTLSVSFKPGEGGKALTEFAMGMLDISTGLLKALPEKPSLSRSGSAVDFEAARRGSLLAMGVGGGMAAIGGPGSLGQFGGGGPMPGGGIPPNGLVFSGGFAGSVPSRGGGFHLGMMSTDVSGTVSPRSNGSGGESSDEGMPDQPGPRR